MFRRYLQNRRFDTVLTRKCRGSADPPHLTLSRPTSTGVYLRTIEKVHSHLSKKPKQGTYLWLSAYPIPKDEENLENLQLPKTVEVKIFIDDKLHKSNSGENYAMVQHIFGQENYQ